MILWDLFGQNLIFNNFYEGKEKQIRNVLDRKMQNIVVAVTIQSCDEEKMFNNRHNILDDLRN